MKLLFWFCFAMIAYAYVGYAVWLSLWVRVRRRAVLKRPITPRLSVVIAARNEEANLPRKLLNLSLLDYPRDQMEVIVVSDGSTDRTAEILRKTPGILPLILEASNGKATALNEAVRLATGEILVFLDVRQTIDNDALSELAVCFADPEVGAVSGELLLESPSGIPSEDGLGLYWKIEKMVRRLESESGSVVGATGAIYAVRRELYTDIPAGTLLDDVFVPMNVARAGKRVVFQPSAIARDRIFDQKGKEFSRKVRTLTGNYQLVRLAPWLISFQNPLLFRFVSHKLLRLLVPLFLLGMLAASAVAGGRFYVAIFWLQTVFYALAILGTLAPAAKKLKPVAIASTFVMLNAAAAMALYSFLAGRRKIWV